MSMWSNPIMIDLHNLRIGTFWNTGLEDGKRWVEYIPLNGLGFSKVRISNMLPNALRTVHRRENLPGTFPQYQILMSGEHGHAWFLKDYLGQVYPEIIKQMHDQKEELSYSRAAIESRERQVSRGEQTAVQDLMRAVKSVQSDRRPEDDKKRRLGGGLIGR